MKDRPHLITYVMNLAFYIILSILLVLWILSIICRRRRALLQATRIQAVGRLENPIIVAHPTNHELPPGLGTWIIETFPKFPYSRSDQDSDRNTAGECSVCLGAFEEKESLRMLPKCGHVFHADCVDIWLRMHATCPFCRAVLSPDDPPTSEGPTPVGVVSGDEVEPSEGEVLVITLNIDPESDRVVIVQQTYE